MELSIDNLKNIALKVYKKIHPLIGMKEAAQKSELGAGGDITMLIDTVAENVIIESLKQLNVDILLISEEIGEIFIGNRDRAIKSKRVLIVDPLDGSNNAVRGIPYSSVSLAYAEGTHMKDIIKAVIIDIYTKDVYWAVKNKGAFLNNNPISVSEIDITEKCFFELNLPMKNLFTYINKLAPIIKRFYRVRILGSSALTLCHIAKGSMEAFINLRTSNRLVDVAAGFLILKEAGGKIFSINGTAIDRELSINTKFPFVACNAKIELLLKEMMTSERL
ncbi:MAG: inositol monophosphatase family protein [Promethearchaeota archaeon]